jgi:CheY-like chemotaxis protein
MHVLAIEEADAALLRRGFADHVGGDHTLAVVPDVAAAVPHLRQRRPDLIILDLPQPGARTADLFARYADLVGETPVLVWTQAAEDDARALAQALADGYVHRSVAPPAMWASAIALAREAAKRPRLTDDLLVVNDNVAERALWRDVFEPHLGGGALLEAETVAGACAILEQGLAQHAVPRVLLIDYHLPGETGEALLEWIAQRNELAAVRSYVLSGSLGPRLSEACKRLGARDVLIKPFTLDGWESVLIGILARRGHDAA